MSKTFIFFATSVFLILFLSCSKKGNGDDLTYQVSKLKSGYANSYDYLLEQHQSSVTALSSKISNFNSLPIITNFQQSKDLWLTSNEDFLLLGPYRYTSDNTNPFLGNEFYFDVFPINPAYIDYTVASPGSGIVNDPINYPSISSSSLDGWHQIGSPNNATIGYHCIEFMLWGEDNNSNGPGQRVHQDFVGMGSPEARRRQYINSAAQSLLQKTNMISTNTLKETLLAASPKKALQLMFDGLLSFIEKDVAEKSLLIPYNSQSQTDELCQFSDNTNSAIRTKIRAIQLFLDPRPLFATHSDYYLIDFIKEKDADTYDKVTELLNTLAVEASGWQNSFDNAITNGTDRPKIYQLYQHVIELHSVLKEFASRYH